MSINILNVKYTNNQIHQLSLLFYAILMIVNDNYQQSFSAIYISSLFIMNNLNDGNIKYKLFPFFFKSLT